MNDQAEELLKNKMEEQIRIINEVIAYCKEKLVILDTAHAHVHSSRRNHGTMTASIKFTLGDFDYTYYASSTKSEFEKQMNDIHIWLRKDSPCRNLLKGLDYPILWTHRITIFDLEYDPFEQFIREDHPISKFKYRIKLKYGKPSKLMQKRSFTSSFEWLGQLYLDMEYLARIRITDELYKYDPNAKNHFHYMIEPEHAYRCNEDAAREPLFIRYLNMLTPITEDSLKPVELHIIITDFRYNATARSVTPIFIVTHHGEQYYPLEK